MEEALRNQIEDHLKANPLVYEVDRAPNGHVRIETRFKYPDGTSLEVFVPDNHGLFQDNCLTDFGQTLAWLHLVQVEPRTSKKRQHFLRQVLNSLGVRQDGGALSVDFDSDHLPGSLDEPLLQLVQACLRTSDLLFTRRSSLQEPFEDELEEVVADLEIPYDRDQEILGATGRVVKVDFLVRGQAHQHGVLTLSPRSPQQAQQRSKEIFIRWYDLGADGISGSRVTVYDDRLEIYKEADLERLEEQSQVIGFTSKDFLRDVLAA